MPFKSKAQQRFMFSQHPEIAKEFAKETPDFEKLPDHVRKMADGGEVDLQPEEWQVEPTPADYDVHTSNGPVRLPPFVPADSDAGPKMSTEMPNIKPDDMAIPAEPKMSTETPDLSPFDMVIPGAEASSPAPAASAPTLSSPTTKTPLESSPRPAVSSPGTDLSGEMAAAEKLLGTGPNDRAALMKALGAYQRKEALPSLIAGIGDAIASGGTLGKVNPRGQEAVMNRTMANEKMATEQLSAQQAENEKAFEAAKEMEGRDPNSQFSKMYLATVNKVLGKYGVTLPAGVSAVQASQILGPTASIIDAQARLAMEGNFRQQQVDVEKLNAGTNAARLEEEKQHQREQERENAENTLAKQGVMQRLVTPGIVEDALKKEAVGGTDSPITTGPLGPTTVRGGKTYEWSSVDGKYHLAQ